jgi:hypothetical protein
VSALVETSTVYRFYFGVYVRNVSRLTPIYMDLIEPFRKFIVVAAHLRFSARFRLRCHLFPALFVIVMSEESRNRRHRNDSCRNDERRSPCLLLT